MNERNVSDRSVIVNLVIVVGLLAAVVVGVLVFLAPKFATSESYAIARGQAVYNASCAACHGANLQGAENWQVQGEDGSYPPPPHDEEGHTFHHPDSMLLDYIKRGGAVVLAEMGVDTVKSGMPPFEDVLSDDEIEDVLTYIKSTWSEETRAYQEEVTAADEAASGS